VPHAGMPANGCLFSPPSDAPSSRRPTLQRSCHQAGGSRYAGHQLGQQYCPMQNMANSRLKYKSLHKPACTRLKPESVTKRHPAGPDPPRIFTMSRSTSGSWDPH
jgi:hypothetical protein